MNPSLILRAVLLGGMASLCSSCTTQHKDETGFLSLRKLRATSNHLYPEQSSNDLFRCNDAELAKLYQANVFVNRIGIETIAHPLGTGSFKINAEDDGALLGMLLDYDSYGDSTLCDFAPAMRVTLRTYTSVHEFDVCFVCNKIAICCLPNQTSDGSLRVFRMSPGLRGMLLDLAQSVFPNDTILKPLYRKRGKTSQRFRVRPGAL